MPYRYECPECDKPIYLEKQPESVLCPACKAACTETQLYPEWHPADEPPDKKDLFKVSYQSGKEGFAIYWPLLEGWFADLPSGFAKGDPVPTDGPVVKWREIM